MEAGVTILLVAVIGVAGLLAVIWLICSFSDACRLYIETMESVKIENQSEQQGGYRSDNYVRDRLAVLAQRDALVLRVVVLVIALGCVCTGLALLVYSVSYSTWTPASAAMPTVALLLVVIGAVMALFAGRNVARSSETQSRSTKYPRG